jgi:hypothetical protein
MWAFTSRENDTQCVFQRQLNLILKNLFGLITELSPTFSSKLSKIQGAAEITPTFQKGITNKWYEISPKTFYFPNVDIKKFFYFGF